MRSELNYIKPEDLGAYYESILDKEVRKAGGVYYTPQYIVDYIVENTVGKLIENKTPREVNAIKVSSGRQKLDRKRC